MNEDSAYFERVEREIARGVIFHLGNTRQPELIRRYQPSLPFIVRRFFHEKGYNPQRVDQAIEGGESVNKAIIDGSGIGKHLAAWIEGQIEKNLQEGNSLSAVALELDNMDGLTISSPFLAQCHARACASLQDLRERIHGFIEEMKAHKDAFLESAETGKVIPFSLTEGVGGWVERVAETTKAKILDEGYQSLATLQNKSPFVLRSAVAQHAIPPIAPVPRNTLPTLLFTPAPLVSLYKSSAQTIVPHNLKMPSVTALYQITFNDIRDYLKRLATRLNIPFRDDHDRTKFFKEVKP